MSRTIEAEFETGLKDAEQIIQQWKEKTLTGRLAFHKLRDHSNNFRKYLANRYDGLRSSDYLMVVAAILNDGYITQEDIEELSGESKEWIEKRIEMWKEHR